MDAVYLTLFVSSVLAGLGLVLFVFTHGQRTRDHNYRLALMPLDDPLEVPLEVRPSEPAAPLPSAFVPSSDQNDPTAGANLR